MQKNKRIKVQITLPEELSNMIDSESHREFMTKSAWIERSIVNYIEKKKENDKVKKRIELNI